MKISTLSRTPIKIVISIGIFLWDSDIYFFAIAHSKNKVGNNILQLERLF